MFRSSGLRGRMALQMVVVVVAVTLMTLLAFYTLDITPSAKVIKVEGMERAIKEALKTEGAVLSKQDSVVVSFDEIMKAPVTLAYDDPRLIQRIRTKYLLPPSVEPYPSTITNFDPSKGQSKQIRQILGDKVKDGGFFVECGALDGLTRSNSLVFEKEFGWQGVLIEGDPRNFNLIPTKNRKAWAANACLSTKPYPNVVVFRQSFNLGKISDLETVQNKNSQAEVQCFPLYSILLALNTTRVDYFSLDVEGAELKVLQTIPWDKVEIKTLSVEFAHTEEGKEEIRRYMKKQGYSVFSEVTHPGGLANDFIFAKNELIPSQKR